MMGVGACRTAEKPTRLGQVDHAIAIQAIARCSRRRRRELRFDLLRVQGFTQV
jgi:hypothetical protein